MRRLSLAGLKRKLDKVFSEYTRRRFADENGYVACVSCGVVKHWKEMQAGHFVTRRRLATRWDVENTAPQCGKCNVLLRGNPAGYARWLVNRYGQSIFADLVQRSHKPVKFTRADINQMATACAARLKSLGRSA